MLEKELWLEDYVSVISEAQISKNFMGDLKSSS